MQDERLRALPVKDLRQRCAFHATRRRRAVEDLVQRTNDRSYTVRVMQLAQGDLQILICQSLLEFWPERSWARHPD